MILHISNDYSGSSVYRSLIKEFDHLGMTQIVYHPIREQHRLGKNEIPLQQSSSAILYRPILNKHTDRMFYRLKIRKIVKDIEASVDIKSIRLIHAHTWYSDGGAAYLLSRKYNIPYLVTIRNADINAFYKFLIHERRFGKKILSAASHIFLIAAAYQPRLLAFFPDHNAKADLLAKISVIPNGVDAYWINNARNKKVSPGNLKAIQILFIGKFNRGKRIRPVQQAIQAINRKGIYRLQLHLIGGGGTVHNRVVEVAARHPKYMTYHGSIFDLDQLALHFQHADMFVMPSSNETFGLVYIEALLQGLPVLYTEHEGIDGYYEEKIGEKVRHGTVMEIAQKIETMIQCYDSYQIPTEKIREQHNWVLIAKKYQLIYNQILGQTKSTDA